MSQCDPTHKGLIRHSQIGARKVWSTQVVTWRQKKKKLTDTKSSAGICFKTCFILAKYFRLHRFLFHEANSLGQNAPRPKKEQNLDWTCSCLCIYEPTHRSNVWVCKKKCFCPCEWRSVDVMREKYGATAGVPALHPVRVDAPDWHPFQQYSCQRHTPELPSVISTICWWIYVATI